MGVARGGVNKTIHSYQAGFRHAAQFAPGFLQQYPKPV
jgi:hypothetical protein